MGPSFEGRVMGKAQRSHCYILLTLDIDFSWSKIDEKSTHS